MNDAMTIGVAAIAIGALLVAVYTTVRTRDVKPLEKWVAARTTDKQMITQLELQFARLPLARQEAIIKLIDVFDPLTNLWPGDLDNNVLGTLREVTDGVPLKDKPPVEPLESYALHG